jgi:protoporphyrinogen oxidase
MAGFGAAHRLHSEGLQSVMYEKRPYHGGHTASHRFEAGFLFDEGPHISFTKIDRIKKIFAESVNNQYESFRAKVNNYWKGYWIKHPAQCNLNGLPQDLVVNILKDFIDAQHNHKHEIGNYEDWLKASFGKTFAETFPMEYGLKYHTTTANNMSIDWLGPRLYQPKLEEVLLGAISPQTPDVHYISHCRYPSYNGFVSFLDLFLNQTDIRLNHTLVRIDPKRNTLHFANGAVDSYDYLISSIPLPELIPMIAEVPSDVLEASQKLACSEVVVVCVGISRPDIIDAHWTYFYDRDIFFTRLCTPHLQSPNNVPSGCGSIMAECYFSKKYRPLDRKPVECIEPVIDDLKRCGLFHEEDKILFKEAMHLKYANVIFDMERADAIALIHGYLDDLRIRYCGRYGLWGYIWTDQAFISGEKAAQQILDHMSA